MPLRYLRPEKIAASHPASKALTAPTVHAWIRFATECQQELFGTGAVAGHGSDAGSLGGLPARWRGGARLGETPRLTSRSGWPGSVVIDVVKDHEGRRAQPMRPSRRAPSREAHSAAQQLPRLVRQVRRMTPAHAAPGGARDHAAVRTLGADQHTFGRIACRSRRGNSAVLTMLTTANREHAGSPCSGARRIPGRVRSCDNASSGAREVRAATSRPRSGGSGLYAPPRGHDQGRACGRWPRGEPDPLARLEG